jgi:hypothetical protein
LLSACRSTIDPLGRGIKLDQLLDLDFHGWASPAHPKVSARAGFCILGEMMNIITATKTIPASTT